MPYDEGGRYRKLRFEWTPSCGYSSVGPSGSIVLRCSKEMPLIKEHLIGVVVPKVKTIQGLADEPIGRK
jgi:hypothetical protein